MSASMAFVPVPCGSRGLAAAGLARSSLCPVRQDGWYSGGPVRVSLRNDKSPVSGKEAIEVDFAQFCVPDQQVTKRRRVVENGAGQEGDSGCMHVTQAVSTPPRSKVQDANLRGLKDVSVSFQETHEADSVHLQKDGKVSLSERETASARSSNGPAVGGGARGSERASSRDGPATSASQRRSIDTRRRDGSTSTGRTGSNGNQRTRRAQQTDGPSWRTQKLTSTAASAGGRDSRAQVMENGLREADGNNRALRTRTKRRTRKGTAGDAVDPQRTSRAGGATQIESKKTASSRPRYDPEVMDDIQRALLHGNEPQIRKALGQLSSGRVFMPIEEFDNLLATLNRMRRLRSAIALVRLSESSPFSQHIQPYQSVKTLTIMIDLFGKARHLEKAFQTFQSLADRGMKPNVITFNALISACSRNGESKLAHQVFLDMQYAGLEPDKFTFASLIDVHAKRGDVDRAFEVASLMTEMGVRKDQTIYSALMEACSRARELDRALHVFQDMVRTGVWPNLISFAVLLDCCANMRKPYKAFELFAEMRYWNLEPNVVTWTALLDACSKAGWPERGEMVLVQMRAAGVEPNEVTYGALVDAWARQGHLERAFDAVHRMCVVDKVAPNAVLVGALVDACRRTRDGSYMSSIWQLVEKYNIRPARAYYPALVSLASLARDTDTALSVVAHCHARGMLRRMALSNKDPVLSALVVSFACLWKACEECEDSEVQLGRLTPLLNETVVADIANLQHDSVEDAYGDVIRRCETTEVIPC